MKHLLFLFALLLCGCMSDTVSDMGQWGGGVPIRFQRVDEGATRADVGLETRYQDFRVLALSGHRDAGDGHFVADQTPMDNYVVWYDDQTSSLTNSSDWEYVGSYTQDGHQTTAQTVKFWNPNAECYQFHAVAKAAFGEFQPDGTLAPGHDAKALVAQVVEVEKKDYGQPVVFHFGDSRAKVRLAFYTTIRPAAWQVSDLQFYPSATATQTQDEAVLYGGDGFSQGFAPVAYYNERHLGPVTNLSYAGPYLQTDEQTPGILTLRLDYTLRSGDSNEEIHRRNVTAQIPAEYTHWEANKAYTYVFKVTDAALHPITLTAVYDRGGENIYGNQNPEDGESGQGDTDPKDDPWELEGEETVPRFQVSLSMSDPCVGDQLDVTAKEEGAQNNYNNFQTSDILFYSLPATVTTDADAQAAILDGTATQVQNGNDYEIGVQSDRGHIKSKGATGQYGVAVTIGKGTVYKVFTITTRPVIQFEPESNTYPVGQPITISSPQMQLDATNTTFYYYTQNEGNPSWTPHTDLTQASTDDYEYSFANGTATFTPKTATSRVYGVKVKINSVSIEFRVIRVAQQ